MAQFTFYHNPMSRAAIASWALAEVGADHETVLVDWNDKPDGLLAANPMGKVPVLVHHHADHDHIVTETPAICHYLAHTHPDAGLLPNEHEAASYFRWLFFAAGPLEAAITVKAMGWQVSDGKAPTTGFGTYELAVGTLDKWLSANDFVCGDRFTMADVYVGSHVDWGLRFNSLPDRDSFRNYQARIHDRDAYREASQRNEALIQENKDG